MVSGLSPETGCRKYIQAGVVKDTSSAISKSDFLVADELASFSDDPAQLYVGSVDGARVFALNVLECPRCRSRMRILAAIEDPVVARKILDCLGLPSRAPPVAPARHNRQDELAQF